MEVIELTAPAKINLFLDIKAKRNDGYHELVTIMQSISLCDKIKIKKNNKNNISLSCSNDNLPEGKENLAYQAAELILQKAHVKTGININIEKKIPIAAGLGGGSTDAAAVLKGVNSLLDLGYSFTQLQEMGATIGSDVPFCLCGGTALATGRGNKLQQLTDLTQTDLILVKPPLTISTGKIYNKFDKLKTELDIPDIPAAKLVKLIENKVSLNWDEGWSNVLEPVTETIVSEIRDIKKLLYDFNVDFCLMTGSGPTVFAVVQDTKHGHYITQKWPRSQDYISIYSTIGKRCYNS